MMREIEVMKWLIQNTEQTLNDIEEYKKAEERARQRAESINAGGEEYYRIFMSEWDKPEPKKTVIKENMKMIRRVSLMLEKDYK